MNNIKLIFLLILSQIFILNEFLFYEYINPYIYIIAILFLPIQYNKVLIIVYGFFYRINY